MESLSAVQKSSNIMSTSLSRPEPKLAEQLELESIVAQTLECAAKQGSTAARVNAQRTRGYEMNVRFAEVETVQHHNEKDLSVEVYFGNRSGSATTSDFGTQAIMDTVGAACSIAKRTADDPCNGLPEPERLASEFPDLELNQPWDLDRDKAYDLALRCENAARNEDKRIVNSEGAAVSTSARHAALGNSDGFLTSTSSSMHYLSCVVVGESESGMQRDYWYNAVRDATQMDSPELVGKTAATRTVQRLDARRMKTCEVPVLIEAPVAGSLLRHLVEAIRGANLYRKTSFLVDCLGRQIFPSWVRIHEQPHLKRAIGSSTYDAEGVATKARDIVSDGVLTGYVLNSYSARKLGMKTTGNAGGVFNLTADPGAQDFAALLRTMDTGLLVTEFIGFGVNTVTGDYSRGAGGFWVENGEIQYPVEQVTIAGNLKDMFQSIIAIGSDMDPRRSVRTGSILLERAAVGGQ